MRQLRWIGILAATTFLWLAVAGKAAAADFPKGVFTMKSPDGATWTVTFDGKDKFTVARNGMQAVEGTYKVTKDVIALTDKKGPLADPESGAGTYKWKVEDGKLKLTLVKDKSKGRSTALTAGAWQPKK